MKAGEVKRASCRENAGARLLVLLFLLAAAVVVSTGMGYMRISAVDVARIILSAITGSRGFTEGLDKTFAYVVLDIRLPRVMSAALVGSGLSISGVVFQGILLNPLADPYTLGISAGAAFGASVALFFGISLYGVHSVFVFAFAGALAALFFVIFLASFGVSGRISSSDLILSGIIVASILSAGISFIKYVADEQVSIIVFWLMGSFASKTWMEVFLSALFVSLGFIISLFYARDLNVMCLGDRAASSLGVLPHRTRIILLVTASMMTAVCVSVSGIIGFVGLVVPHLMRFITGSDSRILIPSSALAGGILLVLADTLTRAVLPVEIPIGVLTALIGGPFFCYIFKKTRSGAANGL